MIFSLTNTIYWCKIFKWAVSDSGSTGALQALGKSSILLRSTKFMNVSDKYKLLWFATPRSASRCLYSILWNKLEFKNVYNLSCSMYTHEVVYDHDKYSDYKIIMCVRNPYSKFVSTWQWAIEGNDTFEKYVLSDYNWNDVEIHTIDICKKYNRSVDFLFKYETIDSDVLKLPYDLEYNLIKENIYKSNLKRLNDGKYSDYKFYYNQELADIVFERNQNIFEFFGYERDSWKYL